MRITRQPPPHFPYQGGITVADERGLSLLGVLMALFLLAAGSLAAAQLLARNQQTAGLARERFVATTLAREGQELLRAKRDSNWFALRAGDDDLDLDSWVDGICEPGAALTTLLVDRDQFGLIVQPIGAQGTSEAVAVVEAERRFAASDAQEQAALIAQYDFDNDGDLTIDDAIALVSFLRTEGARLYLTDDGRYTHQSGGGANASLYTRTVTVDCTNQAPDEPNVNPALIEVTSRVAWQRGDAAEEVVLTARLYDWFRYEEI